MSPMYQAYHPVCCPCCFLRCVCWYKCLTFHFPTALAAKPTDNKRYHISSELASVLKSEAACPSAATLGSSHPCECARWPRSLSRLLDERCAAFEGQSSTQTVSSSCLRSPAADEWVTVPLLQFSHSQLQLIGNSLVLCASNRLALNLLFSILATSPTPYFSIFCLGNGQWQQQHGLTGLVLCSVFWKQNMWLNKGRIQTSLFRLLDWLSVRSFIPPTATIMGAISAWLLVQSFCSSNPAIVASGTAESSDNVVLSDDAQCKYSMHFSEWKFVVWFLYGTVHL